MCENRCIFIANIYIYNTRNGLVIFEAVLVYDAIGR